ncbi:hypothetical protein BJ508DRAFT_374278, partial [Ascobolus immersus RN42]
MSVSGSPTSTIAFTPASTRRSSISSQISNLTLTPRAQAYDALDDATPMKTPKTQLGYSSRYREFHTIVYDSETGKFRTDFRLKAKRKEGEAEMSCDAILKCLDDMAQYEVSALLGYIATEEEKLCDGYDQAKRLGIRLTVAHLVRQSESSNEVTKFDLELVPSIQAHRQFYLLRNASQVVRRDGRDHYESRDWRTGPLDNDVSGIIRLKSGQECLSLHNNVQDEVLKWWEKTMVVLVDFMERISTEHFDGMGLIVSTAMLYDNKLCLKIVEVVPV